MIDCNHATVNEFNQYSEKHNSETVVKSSLQMVNNGNYLQEHLTKSRRAQSKARFCKFLLYC